MGTPDFAVPSLKAIAEEGHELVGVVTAPDKPAGRGQKLKMSPVKEFANTQGWKVLQPRNLKSEEFAQDLAEANPELIVVVAFRMLPESVWSFPEKGTINLHGSLLPQYRGAAPINWAVMNGENETGLTTFFIQKEIDTGRIIQQDRLSIADDETAGGLHDRMMHVGANLLVKTLADIQKGSAKAIEQDQVQQSKLLPAPKIFKEDCLINWNDGLKKIHNHIRGLSPYPTAWSNFDDKTIKFFACTKTNKTALLPGTIETYDGRMFVSCSDGVLEILELQLAGKKRMKTSDFLRGYSFQSEAILS